MGFVVEQPITVHVDNVGAIFLSYNTSEAQWNKHIYLHHHFTHDYVEYITLKVQFFHSEENLTDPFAKNLSNGPFYFLTSR